MIVSAITTIFQAAMNHTVDILLALILMIGGVIGAQGGAIAGQRLRAEHLRFLLALLVLAVGARLAADLLISPEDTFSVTRTEA